MGIISKIFGTHSEREIKRIIPLVDKIESLADEYKALSDEQLKAKTAEFKKRLADGETLDDILCEAFATVREASDRVLGKRHYRVQLIGGIIIHQGRIAEMRTGEGKTLVATLPAYLNALSGKGVHVVTVNDYLAKRDSEWMGKVYNYLGLTVGLIIHDIKPEDRKAQYDADITYGTNNEFGFDYLRDNMVIYKEHMVQRGHNFAVVDEVDSILIDEARTPLIISGQGNESSEIYETADKFARTLKVFRIKELDDKKDNDDIDADYIVDEKANTAVLTKYGIEKAESFFKLENLTDPENSEIAHHINQAIRAHGVMKRDVDYVVKDGEVIIVDGFTGRLMHGRRYSNGLHQAIEAKEHVKVEKESKTLATITFQNYFRLYSKLSGMTGTALTEESEFREIYNLDVIEIPTNRPMIRKDNVDLVYKTRQAKLKAIVEQIKKCHEKGQPVLVGTVSIDKSEELSRMLTKENIKHNVLNAKLHEKEAEIVAQAGKFGAVTIATNMAGRGTDIMLGGNAEYLAKQELEREGIEERLLILCDSTFDTDDAEILEVREKFRILTAKHQQQIAPEAEKVRAAGGLYILGTERHEARRIDNQLRGRAGRQGDPGESTFFLSFEDDLMRLFGSDRVMGMVNLALEDDKPMDMKIISGTIETAQKNLEDKHFNSRKNVLKFDDVMNQQRTIIYDQRREVLNGENIKEKIANMMESWITSNVDTFCSAEAAPDDWNFDSLRAYFAMFMMATGADFRYDQEQLSSVTSDDIKQLLIQRANEIYAKKEELFGADDMREAERTILLGNVDDKWMEHIDAMDDLKEGIYLQAYAQHDPVTAYKIEGSQMFEEMVTAIREDTVKSLIMLQKQEKPIERKKVAIETGASHGASDGSIKRKPIHTAHTKVGRNDLCPCGSGKKYKKCCGWDESN
ncbi:MAG: preprotein translocase subunit SecA [Ruminococcaceae bacterium]|nr:preprotein translocase subunit SecA [Oscillospiraceae bacterium]